MGNYKFYLWSSLDFFANPISLRKDNNSKWSLKSGLQRPKLFYNLFHPFCSIGFVIWKTKRGDGCGKKCI